jgi:D-serine deaminase-like pyridoxal phosphate-dependent protein
MGALFEGLSSRRLRDDARLVSLSQEHGLVDRALPWGEKVRILPNHACLTVACFDAFHVVRGEEVLDRWTVHRER